MGRERSPRPAWRLRGQLRALPPRHRADDETVKRRPNSHSRQVIQRPDALQVETVDTAEIAVVSMPSIGRRSIGLVVDQGVNGGSNLVITIVVAAHLSVTQFGVYVTIQAGVSLVQSVFTAALGERLLQVVGSQRNGRFGAGQHLIVRAGCLMTPIAIVSLLWGGNAAFVALFAAPAIVGLDNARLYLLASDAPLSALRIDVFYATAQLIGVGIWITVGNMWRGATGAWIAWGSAAWITFGLFTFVQARRRHSTVPATRPLRSAVRLRYGIESLITGGSVQIALLIVVPILGLAFNGLFRATNIPFGISILVLQASRSLVMPALKSNPKRTNFLVTVLLLGFLAVTLLAGVFTLFAAHSRFLGAAIGGHHPGAQFVVCVGLTSLGFGIQFILYLYRRAVENDAIVTTSRSLLLISLVPTILVTWITKSETTFLLCLSVSWLVSSVALLPRVGERIANYSPF